jgi:hypothetical protein
VVYISLWIEYLKYVQSYGFEIGILFFSGEFDSDVSISQLASKMFRVEIAIWFCIVRSGPVNVNINY